MKLCSAAILIAATAITSTVYAWDKDDHEIFRLRDELEKHEGPGVTFYEFLEVPRSAKQIDIDRAFRKRSKALHPDKARQSLIAARATAKPPKASSGAQQPSVHVNKPPTEKEIKAAEKIASERFTRLGLIAEILKDDRRRSYDHFLDNGFPKWRGTGYYYSRFRPGLTSTLLGLFVFSGGLLHYIVLVLGYKQQRDFVERYIRQARQAAWGNSSTTGIAASIPGLSDAALGNGATPEEDEAPLVEAINRRDRRAQEKEAKKNNKGKTLKPPGSRTSKGHRNSSNSGTATPLEGGGGGAGSGTSTPVPGARKRVEAENGKILVVDRAGNVFLEEEDEETEETSLLLLDPDEIQRPTFKQTFLYRLPVWVVGMARDRVNGGAKLEEEEEEEEEDTSLPEAAQEGALSVPSSTEPSTTRQRKRKSKK